MTSSRLQRPRSHCRQDVSDAPTALCSSATAALSSSAKNAKHHYTETACPSIVQRPIPIWGPDCDDEDVDPDDAPHPALQHGREDIIEMQRPIVDTSGLHSSDDDDYEDRPESLVDSSEGEEERRDEGDIEDDDDESDDEEFIDAFANLIGPFHQTVKGHSSGEDPVHSMQEDVSDEDADASGTEYNRRSR